MEGHEVIVVLSDAQLTRLMDIQEFDKEKQDEAIAHCVELGISARENSIKATRKRLVESELSKGLELFNKHLARNPALAANPVELLKVMQSFGIGINSLATEVAQSSKSKAA